MLDGNTTPSERTMTIGRRFTTGFSGGMHPRTSVHLTSTNDEGSEPKKMWIGSVLLKFSPYTVSILDRCGLGLESTPRDCEQFVLGASAARSGGRYFTTAGNGVTGFEGMGNDPV